MHVQRVVEDPIEPVLNTCWRSVRKLKLNPNSEGWRGVSLVMSQEEIIALNAEL